MVFALISLLFGQYAGVYVPHSPPHVEQGTVITTGSADIEVFFRTPTDQTLGAPVISSFGFSPDGYNEIGAVLPWLRVSEDTTWPVYLGNLTLYYKRNIVGSLRFGYLAAKASIEMPTSKDTFGIEEHLGGRRTLYGLGISYTYELPILSEYHDLFGRLPVIATLSLEDAFLARDHEAKEWRTDFASGFGWGISAEILPLDYIYVGAAIQGGASSDPEVPEGLNLTPYLGLRWYWCEVNASYRTGGGDGRLEIGLRVYL